MDIKLSDWLGLIGLAVTLGGILVAISVALRMRKPDADKTNAETIRILSEQVKQSLIQQEEMRKKIDELMSAPSQLYKLITYFRVVPKVSVEKQIIDIAEEGDVGEIKKQDE